MSKWITRFLAPVAVGVMAAGCASDRVHEVEIEDHPGLSFLETGRSTKEDLVLRFGLPTLVLQEESLLIWRLLPRSGTLVPASRRVSTSDPRVAAWASNELNLVGVFDETHVLRRYRLLRVGG